MSDINILCLHGCRQDQKMLAGLLKDFTAIAKKEGISSVNFHEAKYDAVGGGKTWYSTPLVLEDIGKIKYSPELVGSTLDELDTVIKDQKINVLIGFSQGGNVVDTYLGYYKSLYSTENDEEDTSSAAASSSSFLTEKEDVKESKKQSPIKVAVIFSGYSLVDPNRETSTIPIMNITSSSDLIVPAQYAPSHYTNIVALEHDKGHKIPTSKPFLRSIVAFIKDQVIRS
jgi:predicted esterase